MRKRYQTERKPTVALEHGCISLPQHPRHEMICGASGAQTRREGIKPEVGEQDPTVPGRLPLVQIRHQMGDFAAGEVGPVDAAVLHCLEHRRTVDPNRGSEVGWHKTAAPAEQSGCSRARHVVAGATLLRLK